ncbi:MAG: phosphoribosylamine--glycine ligase [Chloroflexota bacterium]
MKILVVGGGAREHTLVWKLAQSPKVKEIYVAPGNAGTAQIAQNLDIRDTDFTALTKVAQQKRIDLVVVGPEAPLAEGIVDRFQAAGIPIFGPTRQAARIESSKTFSEELMQKYGIPCASGAAFSDYRTAVDYIKHKRLPVWIKADGLAAGKGAIIAESIPNAVETLSNLMERKTMGVAGEKVIIQEHLTGREMSAFAFTDGNTVIPIVPACDYKRVYDDDRGPNTGGMGSYSPPEFTSPELEKTVLEKIMMLAVRAMAQESAPYQGVLYGGLLITREGPKVIEFNARFGDPEAQVILPRLKTDLLEIILAVINGKLNQIKIECSDDACVGVAMASGGYPVSYKTGFPINGLDSLDKDIIVFHAGTKLSPKGEVLTSGGRVLTVVARGKTIAEARKKVYANISRIHFKGCHYRKDIADIKKAS